MRFENIEFLLLLVVPLALLFLNSKKSSTLERFFSKEMLKKMQKQSQGVSKRARVYILIASLSFAIIALARPVINRGEIKVEKNFIDLVVAFDISKSMFATDIYPNRLEFSKQKFYTLLDNFKEARVGVIGFSSRAFLISPLTTDFNTLKYLVKNMSLDYVTLKGTNLLEPLIVTNELLKNSKQKALLIFSDGGDQKDFSKEINYAKTHNIKVFVYGVATKKGAVIKEGGKVIKNKNGDIVVTRLNENIKELAIKSGGSFMQYSLSKDDIKYLIEDIKAKFKQNSKEQTTIKDKQELFYYPLMVAILLFFIAISSLPRIKR